MYKSKADNFLTVTSNVLDYGAYGKIFSNIDFNAII